MLPHPLPRLFRYKGKAGGWPQLAGWELGNEPDLFPRHNITVSPLQLAEDFSLYRRTLAPHQPHALIIGPDTAEMGGSAGEGFFYQFVAAAVPRNAIDVATWHFYYGPGSSKPQ